MKKIIYFLSLFALAGCSSIVTGTSQTLAVNTTPEGASCSLMREGMVIGHVAPTPGSVVVQKTKHDIDVVCNKQGYKPTKFVNHSGTEGATFGNIVAGGVIGWGIDSATGADNKYTEVMNITLGK